MSGERPLPTLHQTVLDATELRRLFDDLESCAEVLETRAKGSTRGMSGETLSLQACRDALLAGSLRGVQVRYLYADEEWWDTLLRLPEGFRVTRVQPAAIIDGDKASGTS